MRKCLSVPIIIMSIFLGQLAQGQSVSLTIEQGYVRGLPPSVKNTAAYMKITNDSEVAVALIGARSAIANSIMLHRSSSEAGMMKMEHVMSLSIEAHDQVILESGGLHLMIMDLVAPLEIESMVEITLLFQGGLEYDIRLPVISVLEE